MKPQTVVQAFDVHLEQRGLRLEAVVIGGSALVLMGVIARLTKDVDILAPELPLAVREAARAFAAERRAAGEDLQDDWLNNGAMSLGDVLPRGWQARVEVVFTGRAVLLRTLGRADLVKSKLFASADRGTDLEDCLALAPSAAELAEALPWLDRQDGNELWPAHVRASLAELGRRLGHGV